MAQAFPTSAARRALAVRFNLPYRDDMQDWEWEVADYARLEEFLSAFDSALPDEQRYSLMELVLQCVEDAPSEKELKEAWGAVKPLLLESPSLHSATVEYWSCNEAPLDEAFRVSRYIRAIRVGNGASENGA